MLVKNILGPLKLTCALISNLLMHAFVEKMLSLESEDGEDDGTRVDGREGVAGRDEEDVTDAVGARSVVTAEGNDGTQSQAIGVENLKIRQKIFIFQA